MKVFYFVTGLFLAVLLFAGCSSGLSPKEAREKTEKLFPTLPDLTIIGHSGSTGAFMFYCPELDVYLSGTLNQTNEVKNSVVLMVKVLAIIQKINK
ncbi:MAG: hypothetical protein R2757_11805 [Draconibacterium sp.]